MSSDYTNLNIDSKLRLIRLWPTLTEDLKTNLDAVGIRIWKTWTKSWRANTSAMVLVFNVIHVVVGLLTMYLILAAASMTPVFGPIVFEIRQPSYM